MNLNEDVYGLHESRVKAPYYPYQLERNGKHTRIEMRVRLLVAGIPETNGRIARIFHDCDVTFVATLEEATNVLSRQYDVMLVAVRFNESRMFDLLRYARENGFTGRMSIICYRSRPGPVTSTTLALQAIKLASHTLGADSFFDLEGYLSEQAADRALRELVGRLVTSASTQ